VLYIPGPSDPPEISFSVPGEPIYEYDITIPIGWNTIGSVYDFGGVLVADAAHVNTTPTGGIWGSGVYGYGTSGYYFSPAIYAGEGYWSYITFTGPYTSCVLHVEASWFSKSVGYADPLAADKVARLNVDGTELVLALQANATGNPDPALDRLMPPAMVDAATPAYLACGGMQLARDVRPNNEWTLVLVTSATITTDRALVIDGAPHDGTFSLSAGAHKVSIGDGAKLPVAVALHQNNPNPFNPITSIDFDLPEKGNVTLEVYNMLGQKVHTLVSGELEAGYHTVRWNGTDDSGRELVSGVYFYKLDTGNESFTRKMVLLK